MSGSLTSFQQLQLLFQLQYNALLHARNLRLHAGNFLPIPQILIIVSARDNFRDRKTSPRKPQRPE